MDNLTDSITIISVILGILSILVTAFSFLKSIIVQKSQLKELEKVRIESILESSDIIKLGNYLDKEIGQLTISDYVDNQQLTNKVDSLINNLIRFVGTEKEIEAEKEEQKEFEISDSKHGLPKNFPLAGRLGDEFDKIVKELYTGEPWNALARLRRHLEILLMNIAEKNNLKFERVFSLNRQIEILKQAGIIEPDIARNLKYPIHVSNRAIHGEELKQGEAEKAIFHAAYSIDKIINKAPNNG